MWVKGRGEGGESEATAVELVGSVRVPNAAHTHSHKKESLEEKEIHTRILYSHIAMRAHPRSSRVVTKKNNNMPLEKTNHQRRYSSTSPGVVARKTQDVGAHGHKDNANSHTSEKRAKAAIKATLVVGQHQTPFFFTDLPFILWGCNKGGDLSIAKIAMQYNTIPYIRCNIQCNIIRTAATYSVHTS